MSVVLYIVQKSNSHLVTVESFMTFTLEVRSSVSIRGDTSESTNINLFFLCLSN